MTDKVNGLNFGHNYAEEYKKSGEKILDETKKSLANKGIYTPLFQNTKKDESSIQSDSNEVSVFGNVSDKSKGHKDTETLRAKTYSNMTSSGGALDDNYSDALTLKYEISNSKDEIKKSRSYKEIESFVDAVEEVEKGQDDNDKTVNFMQAKFRSGFHSSGKILTSYDKDTDGTTVSMIADVANSYKSKNEKFSTVFGGSYEYAKTKENNNSESVEDEYSEKPDSSDNIEKSGNVYAMAKYDTENYTFAGGGSANIYAEGTELYSFNAGVLHKKSDIALTFKRQIVKINNTSQNSTNVKLTLVNNDKSNSGDIPEEDVTLKNRIYNEANEEISKEETPKLKEFLHSEKPDDYGLGVDLELETTPESDEYGAVFKYSKLLNKKQSQNSKLVVTPFVGAYDVHPSSDEAFKLSTGVLAEYNSKKSNGTNIDASLYVGNNRTIQSGSKPTNTLTASFDTNIYKGKWSGNLNGGYINTNNNMKLSYLNGNVQRRSNNTTLIFSGSISKSVLYGEKNTGLELEAGYSYNF